jgi:thiol-disulfide isomerase/thioredoxin
MQMRRFLQLAAILGSFILPSAHMISHASGTEKTYTAPEFTHSDAGSWLNSKPLKLSDLRGKVVLVDFWTFGCWNCYRSFPWLNSVRDRYAAQGLQIIGVHSPESDGERDRDEVISKAKKFELSNPIMIDNDFSYWKSLSNHYWPAYYIVDKHGKVRAQFVGETHAGDGNAVGMENMIKKLLAEK